MITTTSKGSKPPQFLAFLTFSLFFERAKPWEQTLVKCLHENEAIARYRSLKN